METIEGNLFIRHAKNLNNVHKDSNNFLAVMIILGTNVHGGETFFDGDKMNDIGKISHVIKHSNGGFVVGPFDKNLPGGYIWTDNRAVLYFILHK